MASIVLYFQWHQPHRLARYSVFDDHAEYFDSSGNAEILRRVAQRCYAPVTETLLDLIERHAGRFKVCFSLTGTVLDQLEAWAPEVITLLARAVDTGCCELLGETSHHSLAFLADRAEFRRQVEEHESRMHSLFGVRPTVFRNTELIYSNELAQELSSWTDQQGEPRYAGVLTEGVDRILGFRSPNYLYAPPGKPRGRDGRPFTLLLKNYRLSDDIAFRFSNRSWSEWPLTAAKFARWVDQINGDGHVCNLFMDYETFGEHQRADTGILHFLEQLPDRVLEVNPGHNGFAMPSEVIREHPPSDIYDVPEPISWADTERDLSAWRGNAMQQNAMDELYRLGTPILRRVELARALGDPARLAEAERLIEDWRRLTTSDHVYYMSTKFWGDGDVHTYFSPYESPYDAYINFMNVLDSLRSRALDHESAPA